MKTPGDDGDKPADGPPARAEQAPRAAKWMAPVDVWRLRRPALSQEEARVRQCRTGEREEDPKQHASPQERSSNPVAHPQAAGAAGRQRLHGFGAPTKARRYGTCLEMVIAHCWRPAGPSAAIKGWRSPQLVRKLELGHAHDLRANRSTGPVFIRVTTDLKLPPTTERRRAPRQRVLPEPAPAWARIRSAAVPRCERQAPQVSVFCLWSPAIQSATVNGRTVDVGGAASGRASCAARAAGQERRSNTLQEVSGLDGRAHPRAAGRVMVGRPCDEASRPT